MYPPDEIQEGIKGGHLSLLGSCGLYIVFDAPVSWMNNGDEDDTGDDGDEGGGEVIDQRPQAHTTTGPGIQVSQPCNQRQIKGYMDKK